MHSEHSISSNTRVAKSGYNRGTRNTKLSVCEAIVDQACVPLPQCIREMVPIPMAGLRWSFIFVIALHRNNTDVSRCSIRVIRYVIHYETTDLQCKIKQAIC